MTDFTFAHRQEGFDEHNMITVSELQNNPSYNNVIAYKHYLNGYPKCHKTSEYLVPFVIGLTLCQRKLGKTIIEPLGNISVAFLKCLASSLWGGS